LRCAFFAQILPILAHSHDYAGVHGMPDLQQGFMSDDSIDVTADSGFFGLTIYAHLPYVNCLKPDETGPGKYDIAILGAPFDTVINSYY
jgi:agmatinase